MIEKKEPSPVPDGPVTEHRNERSENWDISAASASHRLNKKLEDAKAEWWRSKS